MPPAWQERWLPPPMRMPLLQIEHACAGSRLARLRFAAAAEPQCPPRPPLDCLWQGLRQLLLLVLLLATLCKGNLCSLLLSMHASLCNCLRGRLQEDQPIDRVKHVSDDGCTIQLERHLPM